MITAFDIVKQLDGLSIKTATQVLESAIRLLTSTQLVSATSPLLEKQEQRATSICPEEPPAVHE
jgi:hypothetical protein